MECRERLEQYFHDNDVPFEVMKITYADFARLAQPTEGKFAVQA